MRKKSNSKLWLQKILHIALPVVLVIALWLIYIFIILQPINNRNWEIGMERLPQIAIRGTSVEVHDIRDIHYKTGIPLSASYINRIFDITKIQQVWFVQERFTIKPFIGFKGVAHTYFVFDFSDQNPIVISVEARREKGETFNAWRGLFNQYELIYIWGSEEDETVRRVVAEHNKLYMYPLTISNNGAKQLFLQLAQVSLNLESQPRFYNTLTSNCTNELAKAANQVKANSIPFNIALNFPGYSDRELYKLGYISNIIPFEDLKRRSYISDIAEKNSNKSDFSKRLREDLQANLTIN
ncbi:hypothetical protein A3B42_03980 [Candidatus Daviesbacteria bacterium RIFCSPLOWO2_01_FULL_38_10]|nr:MAG: hypothetical protein A3B42_03980 [Candidatus Daviesbacteria bacterium RIFCSPLOWO2_01_FULL_38_10]OGE44321.1 MAG: hypothetical protein A3E67_01485 [Candidatus Daviesbacteria bacterium RIFCSPHIGHO2_12_FULL_38_25]OGE67193.1 MAG: hypothetical protein A3H81_05320 [Candidatus Daviesbacteria bacterium RIFCSPLOWO2_02_FULL_38_18]HCB22238.1 hypothetical protein [Candidatus Daviesbacteria bacterium]